jgi:hypothetical protein
VIKLQADVNVNTPFALTISSGAITPTRLFQKVNSEVPTNPDDLTDIQGGSVGDVLLLIPAVAAELITVRHNAGAGGDNIRTADGQDYTMSANEVAMFVKFDVALGWYLLRTYRADEVSTLISTHAGNASAHHTKYTDGDAQTAAVDDTVYGAGWNGVTNQAPSKNAVYDKFESLSFGDVTAAAVITANQFVVGDDGAKGVKDPDAAISAGGQAITNVGLVDGVDVGSPNFSIAVVSNRYQLTGDETSPGGNKMYGTNAGGTKGWHEPKPLESFILAVSDETTDITTGTAKVTFRMPYAFTVTEVRASLTAVSTVGTPTIDINEGGVSILSTKITIDANEKSSTTAVTPPVISDSALADDAEITIDIDVSGTGAKGLKVYIKGNRV